MLAAEDKINCSAIMIAAPGDHQGRTSVTAALARYHRNQGRRVKVFKAGPDFFDPLIYQMASGQSADNLDLWMVGESRCHYLLHRAAENADLILLECPVGLYDTETRCADMAAAFQIPLVVVVDGSAGLSNARNYVDDLVTLSPELPLLGVLINKAGQGFAEADIQTRLQDGVSYLGHIPYSTVMAIPDQSFKALKPELRVEIEEQLNEAAELIENTQLRNLPPPVTFYAQPQPAMPMLLEGLRIGVARDEAFCYLYPANIELLENMGAEVCYFSPLHDAAVPNVDSLWFPGGFPELYLQELQNNRSMKASVRDFQKTGGHILAECGGMMFMLGSLVDNQGVESQMVGLLPGRVTLLNHLSAVGHQTIKIDDQRIRGHLFHASRLESDMEPVDVSERRPGKRPAENLYRLDNLTASYVHFYFPSNPLLVAKFFGSPIFAGA